MKILSELSHTQCENALNKLVDYVISFDKEYHAKNEHTEFEAGQRLAYATILDTVKNQLVVDGVKVDVDLEKICTDLLLNKYKHE